MKEKEFLKEQKFHLFIVISIIILSFLLKPGDYKDDPISIFGINIPTLCIHKIIFNKPCAGCGLTRCFVNFAHGNIKKAYEYHRIGIAFYIVVLLQIPIRLYLLKVGSKGYTKSIKYLISIPAIICAIAFIINWLININIK